jgi:hypothetical protein
MPPSVEGTGLIWLTMLEYLHAVRKHATGDRGSARRRIQVLLSAK